MPQELIPVRSPALEPNPSLEWRDLDLIDQVPEERRLGEDLDIQERGRRLQGDRGQLLAAMEPAGGVDIQQRNAEDQPARQHRQPAPRRLPAAGRPAADDMVAVVDGLQQGFQVSWSPRLPGGRHQDQGKARALQALGERDPQVHPLDRHDAMLDRPPHCRHRIDQRCHDRLGLLGKRVGQQDDADPGVEERLAMEVAQEGIVAGLAGRHCGVPAAPASQRSTSWR
ncbi:MAG TPA: hypothetical protein VFF52_20055 [Isosphaeraceae bacterium]|nr:hypothetical protein [Isosphaeraceae bacterium]